ncbi:MAG TPA: DUF6458 family protein [Gaiellaceae bacterium]|nr:DUF6458 family protein [Gaiellaceae bacterium]
MGLAVSLLIAAVGLVLALAIHPASQGSVDVNTVGWILFIVGVIGFVLDLVLWSSWGPGYMRRDATYVQRRPMYAPRRRRIVEEVDDPAPGPPPGY